MKLLTLACAVILIILSQSGLRAEPISAEAIVVVNGDTVDVGPNRYRLIGYDTPEMRTPRRKVSADEKALATIAKEQMRSPYA
jgi:endonuclease YncB( thermonuclease family)